jgi:hypothetical protein
MHVLTTTLVALTGLVVASAQAAPVPNKAHPQGRWHETPSQNVQKSRQYDHLLTANASFRASRMRKECGPIKDPALRGDCMASFNTYEVR